MSSIEFTYSNNIPICITHQNIHIHICVSDIITISTDSGTKVYIRLDRNEWRDNITSYSTDEIYSIIRSILIEAQKSKLEVKLIYTKAA